MRTLTLSLFTVFLSLPIPALAKVGAEVCGPVINGTHDYRAPKTTYVEQVESAHFPIQVENWIRGRTAPLGADIDYTILRLPNHHRALASISQQAARVKMDKLPNMTYPVECYFERAIRFTPDDDVVRMLYAQFLVNNARSAEAAQQLEHVSKSASEKPFTMYNIGLIYFDMKDYAKALAYSHKAMAMGFPRPELPNKLKAAGHWTEPMAAGSHPAASAASAVAPAPATAGE